MIIPVTRDKENIGELIMLNMKDVLYMHIEDRTVVYHTLKDQFYHLLPSLTVMNHQTEAFGFRKLDRINLVNIHQIKYLDDAHGKVYFEEDIKKDSKFATVSFLNKGKRSKEIRDWINRNLGDSTL